MHAANVKKLRKVKFLTYFLYKLYEHNVQTLLQDLFGKFGKLALVISHPIDT